MSFNQESATERAKQDLAERLGVSEDEIEAKSVTATEFRDMSLGASVVDEMAAQMLVSGWIINLEANGDVYEYRADKYTMRLVDFEGTNHVVVA